jgi:cysteine-rich repeat protein
VAWGGDLAGIATQVELTEIGKHPFNNVPSLWTGGYALSPRCAFMWSDSEPWSQDGWRLGEPDNIETPANCVALAQTGINAYQMIDDACAKPFPYLCERSPANVCGDGTLQPGEQCDDAVGPPGKCSHCRVQCLEGEFQDPFTYHCYRQISGENIKGWLDARKACHDNHSQIVTISSAEENALVTSHLDGDAWIGGTWSFTGGEVWDDGEPFCFSAWAASQPALGAGDCISLRPDGTWVNDGCSEEKGFVCERGP